MNYHFVNSSDAIEWLREQVDSDLDDTSVRADMTSYLIISHEDKLGFLVYQEGPEFEEVDYEEAKAKYF